MFISSCLKELKTDAQQVVELQDTIKRESVRVQDFLTSLEEKHAYVDF